MYVESSYLLALVVRAVAMPMFHLLFHKTAHACIHRGLHAFPFLHRANKVFRWLAPELLMLGSLVALHLLSPEGGANGAVHE
jgi:hypothetical protein